jgi:hypothetical protein
VRPVIFALIAAAFGLSAAAANCPMSVWCKYHGTQARRVKFEVRNGATFATFEHPLSDGSHKVHSFTEECQ